MDAQIWGGQAGLCSSTVKLAAGRRRGTKPTNPNPFSCLQGYNCKGPLQAEDNDVDCRAAR
jgi:hypothetical protein